MRSRRPPTTARRAEALGNTQAADLLQQALDEARTIDGKFTKLAWWLISRSGARDNRREAAAYTIPALQPAFTALTLIGLIAAVGALAGIEGRPARNGKARTQRPGEENLYSRMVSEFA